MNIDAYYARQSQPSSPDMAGFYQPSTAPRYTDVSQLPSSMSEDQQQRLMALINNQSPMGTQTVEDQLRMQQRISSDLYQNIPKPTLGPINRQTYGDINQIYYRHYMNGTYGSPEMFNELQAYMDTIRQQQAATPRPTPLGVPTTREYMGMGWQGTPVVETTYQQPAAQASINTAQNRATIEARMRDILAAMGQKGGAWVPTRGGAGGLLPNVQPLPPTRMPPIRPITGK